MACLVYVAASAFGCYRSAELEVARLERIETTSDDGLRVEYRGNETLEYSSYDAVRVSSTGAGDHEFTGVVTGRVNDRVLTVDGDEQKNDGDEQKKTFALTDVEAVRVEQYVPWRPWVVVAATAAGGFLGGALGDYADTRHDVDEEGSHEDVRFKSNTVLGVLAGGGLGFALSFTLTGLVVAERRNQSDFAQPGLEPSWKERRRPLN